MWAITGSTAILRCIHVSLHGRRSDSCDCVSRKCRSQESATALTPAKACFVLQVNLLVLIKSSHGAWMRMSGSAAPLWSTPNLLLDLYLRLPGDSSACSEQPYWPVWHEYCLFSASFLAMVAVMWLPNPVCLFLICGGLCIVLHKPSWTRGHLASYAGAGRLS